MTTPAEPPSVLVTSYYGSYHGSYYYGRCYWPRLPSPHVLERRLVDRPGKQESATAKTCIARKCTE